MHNTVQNLVDIQNKINSHLNEFKIDKVPKIIAVSKTFKIEKILPLINHGHKDFGENKVQEAVDKWTQIKLSNPSIQLHLIGKLQTNKVKFAVKIFDYIHSVDSKKLAKKISDEQIRIDKKIKIFIQVNIGQEDQKSGINVSELSSFISFCSEINLDVVGLMCIPPMNEDSGIYFEKMKNLNKENNFHELSMGMSSDYLKATINNASYLRIGSSIFGARY